MCLVKIGVPGKCFVQPDAEFSAGCTCGVAAKFPQVMMWRVFSLETTSSHAAMRHAANIAGTAVPVGWVHELQRCFLNVFRCLSVAFKSSQKLTCDIGCIFHLIRLLQPPDHVRTRTSVSPLIVSQAESVALWVSSRAKPIRLTLCHLPEAVV